MKQPVPSRKVRALHQRYASLQPEKRLAHLFAEFDPLKVLVTSSFGGQSVFLLHLLHRVRPRHPVHFIDTTYHFLETYQYKQRLAEQLGLRIIDITPEAWKNQFTRSDCTWEKDPDYCCSINKVEPLEALKPGYDVWVSGLMAFQNEHRQQLELFEQEERLLRFYPLLDVREKAVQRYMEKHQLPLHPLKHVGYPSIGCMQCTFRGRGRQGRWIGTAKTECGLHLNTQKSRR